MDDGLLSQARAWAEDDPDGTTRAELEAIIAAVEGGADDDDLADRFAGTLEFGTAGLRGALGPGPNRMNRVVVLRAAAGLAAYLRDTGSPSGSPVVIGYDARYNSDVFATDTAEVMTGAGFRALLLPRPLPTPLLAYAIRELGCVAGVMVTASHNPPQDNGYKVYLGDGSQIVPPADSEIAARIARVGPVATSRAGVPARCSTRRSWTATTTPPRTSRGTAPGISTSSTPPCTAWAVRRCCRCWRPRASRRPPSCTSRRSPTPTSPRSPSRTLRRPVRWTSRWPSPSERNADIVVANDPDADRCAAAVPGPHGWRMLRGDEVGALLGAHLIARGAKGVYACSIVSSSLLGKIAAAAGQPYEETLTGFKWIARVPGLAFGYEEALGYCCDPEHVRDKDGVSALLMLCELAASAKAAGRSLTDLLDDLALEHGLHATDQLSVRVTDVAEISAAMERLRATPPTSLGGLPVLSVDDLSLGSATLPPTEGLRYHLDDDARVIVRPSGTEPKLKAYLEVVIPVSENDGGVDAARISAAGRLDAITQDLRHALGL